VQSQKSKRYPRARESLVPKKKAPPRLRCHERDEVIEERKTHENGVRGHVERNKRRLVVRNITLFPRELDAAGRRMDISRRLKFTKRRNSAIIKREGTPALSHLRGNNPRP